MKCQACTSENVYCIDSREVSTNARRRRYRCIECEYRFSTIEVAIDGNSIEAVKDLPSLIEATKTLQDYKAIAQTIKNLGDLIRCIEKKNRRRDETFNTQLNDCTEPMSCTSST